MIRIMDYIARNREIERYDIITAATAGFSYHCSHVKLSLLFLSSFSSSISRSNIFQAQYLSLFFLLFNIKVVDSNYLIYNPSFSQQKLGLNWFSFLMQKSVPLVWESA